MKYLLSTDDIIRFTNISKQRLYQYRHGSKTQEDLFSNLASDIDWYVENDWILT